MNGAKHSLSLRERVGVREFEARWDSVPAAHSMDTMWFAVDNEGRVGLFDTGEDGALPLDAADLGGSLESSFDSMVFHAALFARARVGAWVPREAPSDDEPHRWLVVKGGTALEPSVFEEISSGPPWVGLSRKRLRYSKLEGRPDFIAVFTDSEVFEEFYEGEDRAQLIQYSHAHGDDPGLYVAREALPVAPLRIEELPQTTHETIKALQLPVDFTAAERVHLADYLAADRASC